MEKRESPPAIRERQNGIAREAVVLTLLVLLTASFWFADQIFPDISLQKLFQTFFAITVIYALFALAHFIATRRIRESSTRYSLNRALSVLNVVVIAAVVVRIWIDTNYIFVAYGIIGAGIAVALQDLFRSFVGGILIVLYGIYAVGDRIEINEREGDVIDIGIFTTTVFEIHAHQVMGEQPTGRIVTIPNGAVLTSEVTNFTKDHDFIWDEISIPITYDSDWESAIETLIAIVDAETREITDRAEDEIEELGDRYYLPRKVVEPSVYLTLTESWITFDIRYVTDARMVRLTRDDLTRKILRAIEQTDDITIAAPVSLGINTETTVEGRAGAGRRTHPSTWRIR
ncbi:mechanosensitive ion channel [Methanoculleus sp. FWC-SCC1]|uniref:Mechanosensitive ion channel n=1 Tax=Methanoculleus frigidifontis TaxID=2584085 RepID=A0ABT8MCR5_9EURY|nr:mechanosensitive ion channel domain-containing protein [Methanoculleus sp. FWC-SCC1]MDN7025729.1 mechanosensitive ion channel [Methanoculleus sp. FWC-SCC1]